MEIAASVWAERAMKAEAFIWAQGFSPCNIAACNCGSWHGGHASERLDEIQKHLTERGFEWKGTILATLEAALPELSAALETSASASFSDGPDQLMASVAISLKRIADALTNTDPYSNPVAMAIQNGIGLGAQDWIG